MCPRTLPGPGRVRSELGSDSRACLFDLDPHLHPGRAQSLFLEHRGSNPEHKFPLSGYEHGVWKARGSSRHRPTNTPC